ncbi:hypothetical protein ALO99_05513 [Pseudomonas coronafaciens pv. porri]|nr:Uncharacterized protein ALO89_05379 [Pseudomonas coronafaciens pv. porri]RMV96890.1 hypothetical protein ALP00_05462 [Pseudomonas coronafaciens pv. porri]RMW06903.1 hypothetical protein ALO99_05513 [Pseudomonas coronafaciens pv. porri]
MAAWPFIGLRPIAPHALRWNACLDALRRKPDAEPLHTRSVVTRGPNHTAADRPETIAGVCITISAQANHSTRRQTLLHQRSPDRDTRLNDLVVEVVIRVVQRRRWFIAIDAHPDVRARTGMQHEGEIFGGHGRVAAPLHAGLPHRCNRCVTNRGGGFGMVFGDRVTDVVDQLAAHTEGRWQTLDEFTDQLLDLLAYRRLQTTHGATQRGGFRNNVDRFTGIELGDADHRRIQWRETSGNNGLQTEYQFGGRHDRVIALVRHGRMATLAGQGNFESVQRRHHCSRIDHHLARRHTRPVVQAINSFHRKQLKKTVVDHPLSAAQVFLGRLKDKMHRTGEPAGFRQVPGGGQQDRRVAVVPAGVHAAFVCRLVHAVAQFLNRQGVHVGTNAYSRAIAVAQGADHTCTTQPAMHLKAKTGEQISHFV